MPKFVTVGYGDRKGYDRTDTALRDVAHAHDARLRRPRRRRGVAAGRSAVGVSRRRYSNSAFMRGSRPSPP
jgi:hypothetical protein